MTSAGWEEKNLYIANYNHCLLNFSVPTSNRAARMSCRMCLVFYSTLFSKQARWEGPSVSIIRSLFWSLSRQTQKLRRSLAHLQRLLPQSRLRFKGFMPRLCNHFYQLFTLRYQPLHKSVRGIHELSSSSSTRGEVRSRKGTGQLAVEQHLK